MIAAVLCEQLDTTCALWLRQLEPDAASSTMAHAVFSTQRGKGREHVKRARLPAY